MYNPMAFMVRLIDKSTLICKRPCYIKGFMGNPEGNNLGIVELRNGTTATAELICTMSVSTSMSQIVPLVTPLYFNKGLYITLTAPVKNMTIMYSCLPFEKLLMSIK